MSSMDTKLFVFARKPAGKKGTVWENTLQMLDARRRKKKKKKQNPW